MKKLQPRIIGVNALGAIGYMLMWMGWILLIAVILALLMERSVIVPTQPIESPTEPQPMFSGLATGVAYIVAAVMVAFTIAVVVLLPYLVGKWSSSALRGLLRLLRVTQAKRSIFLLKSIVTVLPLAGFFIVALLLSVPTILFSMLYIVAVVAVAIALIIFVLQLIIARILHVPERSVW